MRARRAGTPAGRRNRLRGTEMQPGENRIRRGPGAVGNGRIVAYRARSPARSAAEGHARIQPSQASTTRHLRREELRLLFGYRRDSEQPRRDGKEAQMDADMPLERKLDSLMELAGDDHEGPGGKARVLPPRLRHAKEVGALRPLNIRQLRTSVGKVSLMRILMTNA